MLGVGEGAGAGWRWLAPSVPVSVSCYLSAALRETHLSSQDPERGAGMTRVSRSVPCRPAHRAVALVLMGGHGNSHRPAPVRAAAGRPSDPAPPR